jgi:hypothetical protein
MSLSQYAYNANGEALFSDKVIGRFAAMSAFADCYLVSAKGMFYPVHKSKLLEQSKVLGCVSTRCCLRSNPETRAQCRAMADPIPVLQAARARVTCTNDSAVCFLQAEFPYITNVGAYCPMCHPPPSCSLRRLRPKSAC